jgi:hypothetical protein
MKAIQTEASGNPAGILKGERAESRWPRSWAA